MNDLCAHPLGSGQNASEVEALGDLLSGLDDLARRMPVSADMLLISEAIGLIQSLTVSHPNLAEATASHWLSEARRTMKAGQEAVDRVDALRIALEPFVRCLDGANANVSDCVIVWRGPTTKHGSITAGQLRRARSALEGSGRTLADANSNKEGIRHE